jgi:hypothetical protein
MMSVSDWRKRAHACKEASRLASDREGQSGWQALSDAWIKCAEWRDREDVSIKELRGGQSVRPMVSPNRTAAPPSGTSAAESAERLRTRLALGMTT